MSAKGPLLVALGAILWATDALFRAPAVKELDPTWIVGIEHLIGAAFLLPWVFFKHRASLLKLSWRQWLGVAFIGAGASAGATVLFTASFKFLNPSVSILLQKLQPILVVVTAYAFLGERPARRFYAWAPVAILAAIVMTFPNLSSYGHIRGLDPYSKGVIYALSAAAIWALATTIGKSLLGSLSPGVATFWRYVFGLGFLLMLLAASGDRPPIDPLFHSPSSRTLLLSLLYMSLVPGVLAMLAYYNGLARTPAMAATFIELLFPVTAVALNHYYLGSTLELSQLLAAIILIFSVTRVSTTV